jgi:hypothetical protein
MPRRQPYGRFAVRKVEKAKAMPWRLVQGEQLQDVKLKALGA